METCKTGKFKEQNMLGGPEWSEELGNNISKKEKSAETDDSVSLQPEKITQKN